MMRRILLVFVSAVGFALCGAVTQAAIIGEVDDFEDGTTQGWTVNLLGMGVHPAPPANIADGGPNGAGDNFLQLTAVGGAGAGSRLSAINLGQWAGDYAAAGIAFIAMDLINLGITDLDIRLYLENPMGGPPTDDALSSAFFLPAGGGWTTATFHVSPGALNLLNGDIHALLSDVTALRIVHSPTVAFPPVAVAAVLGIDNITAAVPESSSVALFALGIAALALIRWRKHALRRIR